MHQGGDLIVLDIRAIKAFVEGHIENAINIPFSELLKDEEVPLCRDAEIVIVCYFGISSMVVIDILAERGWRNLINMYGGMGAWHYGTIQTNKTA